MLRRVTAVLLSAVFTFAFSSAFMSHEVEAQKKQPKCKEGTEKVPGDGTVRRCKDGDWVVEKKR